MPQRFESPKVGYQGTTKAAPSGDVPVDDGDRVYVAEGELIAGKYRVERILGVGGVGFVVAARHAELEGYVALKFLKKRFLQDKSIAERFTREARAASRIKSEYVARVYDVGSHGRAPFIVMEHLSGRDLAAVLAERGPLPIADAVEYSVQACAALAVAHASGIVHRDIKPENLFLVDEEGTPTIKLLDFGISKVALAEERPAGEWGPEGEALTGRMTCGTPDYMSPEQIRSTATVDARCDVWAMGMVLFEMLTTRTAFRGETVTEVCTAILEQEAPWLSDLRPEVPLGLSDVVAHCLQKDPARRFASVAEMAVAILPFAPPRALAIAEGSAWIRRAAIHAVGSSYAGEGRLSGNPLAEPLSGPRTSGSMPAFTAAPSQVHGAANGVVAPPVARASSSVSTANASRLFRPRRSMALVGTAVAALGVLTVWGLVHALGGRSAAGPQPAASAPAMDSRSASPPANPVFDEAASVALQGPRPAPLNSSPSPGTETAAPAHSSPPSPQPHPRAAPARVVPAAKAPATAAPTPSESSSAPPSAAAPSVASPRPGPPVAPGRPDLGY